MLGACHQHALCTEVPGAYGRPCPPPVTSLRTVVIKAFLPALPTSAPPYLRDDPTSSEWVLGGKVGVIYHLLIGGNRQGCQCVWL